MPNGNILMITWAALPTADAAAAGMRPDHIPDHDSIWPAEIDEVDPKTNQIVWQWRAWDHLIQDTDPSLPNYGIIAQHPERIDINYQKPAVLGDWLHLNSISYNPSLDQIMLSSRNFSEIWIIDHSTTTEEAATASGGQSGMGGDLLYRWGNPAVTQSSGDQQLFGQHDAHWIAPGLPGTGNILIFDNGEAENNRPYSTVVEIAPPMMSSGNYQRGDNGYAPSEIVWQYLADPPESLYAPYISSAERFPNGDTLITDGTAGRFFEVRRSGEIVWEFVNGFAGSLEPTGYFKATSVFRARRYPLDYPGLAALNESP